MTLTDERLGQVLRRDDRRRYLPEANPVLWLFLTEIASGAGRHGRDVLDAGLFLLDLVGANEPDAPRVSLHTASRVLLETDGGRGRETYRYLVSAAADDPLLGMCVDALLAYSPTSRRRRSRRERDAVAAALHVVWKMVRDEAEVRALERALAG